MADYSGFITLVSVSDGTPGEPGVGIASTVIEYATDSSGTTAPSSGWGSTIPVVSEGEFLWTRTTITYTSGNPSVSYSVSYKAEDGEDGNTINVEVEPEQVFKFYTNELLTSNTTVTFRVTETAGDSTTVLTPGVDYAYKVKIPNNNSEFWSSEFNNLLNAFDSVIVKTGEASDSVANWNSLAVSTDTTSVTFNLENTYKYNYAGPSDEGLSALYNNYNQLVSSTNFYYIIEAYDNNNPNKKIGYSGFSFNFGTSQDMAKFAVTAANIQAAVNDAGFVFNGDGLSITNGNFAIYPEDSDTPIFEYNKNNNILTVVGSGAFTGEINATSGSFTGEITATSGSFTGEITADVGSIGGWLIREDGLYSADQNQGIKLKSSGEIIADIITLGTGATIADFIELGRAKLHNPTEYDPVILYTSDSQGHTVTTLTEDGTLQIGNITLDGQNSRIFGGEAGTNNFEITPTEAIFNNIIARGKISTAVFENTKTQAVGGSMYFKPSYKVESATDSTLTLDEKWTGGNEDYVYVVNREGATNGPYKLANSTENIITLLTTASASDSYHAYDSNSVNPFSVIDIGNDDAVIIGINSNSAPIGGLYSRGITIDEFNNTGLPKVFLGDLSSLGTNLPGYGLYSTNVFLNGSLTTVTGESNVRYAGVNTLNGVTATKFGEGSDDDTSPIVFWGGSTGTSSGEIQNAPFQVTQEGSLFAAQGLFEGAIITRSEIRGADIYAARIHGAGKAYDDGEPGLSFYDTSNGIVFFSGEYDSTHTETFSIGNQGLSRGNNQFIAIASDSIDATFTSFNTTGGLQIVDQKIFNSKNNQFYIDVLPSNGIDALPSNEIGFYYTNNNNITQNISLEVGRINLNHTQTYISNNLNLNNKMQYENTTNGYDLYVY